MRFCASSIEFDSDSEFDFEFDRARPASAAVSISRLFPRESRENSGNRGTCDGHVAVVKRPVFAKIRQNLRFQNSVLFLTVQISVGDGEQSQQIRIGDGFLLHILVDSIGDCAQFLHRIIHSFFVHSTSDSTSNSNSKSAITHTRRRLPAQSDPLCQTNPTTASRAKRTRAARNLHHKLPSSQPNFEASHVIVRLIAFSSFSNRVQSSHSLSNGRRATN